MAKKMFTTIYTSAHIIAVSAETIGSWFIGKKVAQVLHENGVESGVATAAGIGVGGVTFAVSSAVTTNIINKALLKKVQEEQITNVCESINNILAQDDLTDVFTNATKKMP